MYRHSLSLFALIVTLSVMMSPPASATEEESGVLSLPELSAGSAQVNMHNRYSQDTLNDAARGAEAIDCFYEWNKNEPACADDSTYKKDARP